MIFSKVNKVARKTKTNKSITESIKELERTLRTVLIDNIKQTYTNYGYKHNKNTGKVIKFKINSLKITIFLISRNFG